MGSEGLKVLCSGSWGSFSASFGRPFRNASDALRSRSVSRTTTTVAASILAALGGLLAHFGPEVLLGVVSSSTSMVVILSILGIIVASVVVVLVLDGLGLCRYGGDHSHEQEHDRSHEQKPQSHFQRKTDLGKESDAATLSGVESSNEGKSKSRRKLLKSLFIKTRTSTSNG